MNGLRTGLNSFSRATVYKAGAALCIGIGTGYRYNENKKTFFEADKKIEMDIENRIDALQKRSPYEGYHLLGIHGSEKPDVMNPLTNPNTKTRLCYVPAKPQGDYDLAMAYAFPKLDLYIFNTIQEIITKNPQPNGKIYPIFIENKTYSQLRDVSSTYNDTPTEYYDKYPRFGFALPNKDALIQMTFENIPFIPGQSLKAPQIIIGEPIDCPQPQSWHMKLSYWFFHAYPSTKIGEKYNDKYRLIYSPLQNQKKQK